MSKNEFLNLLRQSLEGEVDNSIIEQSIRFYNEYISSQSDKSEEEVIKEIGDPRLIAKTIIETENASNRDNFNTYSNRSDYNSYANDNDNSRSSNYNKVYHIKWYHMVVIVLVLLFLITFLVRLGWLLFRLFFAFLMPIIIISLLFWAIFKKR
ncbi:MAG: DUF1700 domain-containing protein [Clostridiales bacterium]|nr:DUF1700 domain-containing protein [Clostridiales bacterium]